MYKLKTTFLIATILLVSTALIPGCETVKTVDKAEVDKSDIPAKNTEAYLEEVWAKLQAEVEETQADIEKRDRPRIARKLLLTAMSHAADPGTRGRICFDLGMLEATFFRDDDKAFTYFKQAVEENPGDAVSQAKLGREYSFRKDWENAEFHFQQALKLNPNDRKTQGWYARMLRQRGK